MSTIGVLSDRYQRISEWLIKFNEAIMFLKDVYLGNVKHERRLIESWMNTVAGLLGQVMQYDAAESPSKTAVPESAVSAIQQIMEKDPFLREKIERVYKKLTVSKFKQGLTESDFDLLDQIAALLSESSSKAFRRIWRHR